MPSGLSTSAPFGFPLMAVEIPAPPVHLVGDLTVPRHMGGLVVFSVGVAAREEAEPGGAAAVLAQADGALYEAKRGGRNRIEIR